MSVPLGVPIVFLTVVTVSSDDKAPINTEKMTRPTKNHIIANTLAGVDLGQRSPYLHFNTKRREWNNKINSNKCNSKKLTRNWTIITVNVTTKIKDLTPLRR